jgi:hypothetical protein
MNGGFLIIKTNVLFAIQAQNFYFQIFVEIWKAAVLLFPQIDCKYAQCLYCTYFMMSMTYAAFRLKIEASGGVVVKAIRYKPAGRGFDFRWCHWNFSVT